LRRSAFHLVVWRPEAFDFRRASSSLNEGSRGLICFFFIVFSLSFILL
jgi:hypothetical protein